MGRKAIIIGAGPAGLTAAYELLKRTDIKPVILEKSGDIGGISKTVNYKGNRIDIGGHRFFSKADRVMQWWLSIMPVEPAAEKKFTVTYQRKHRTIIQEDNNGMESQSSDKVMLVRRRLSRIYFLRRFFTYPIQLSLDTLQKLGFIRTVNIIASYLKAQLFPRKPEKSLEDFLINRFGVKLYLLFFKDYTEKVWGVPCNEISAEWGAQRIKGVSISKAIQHAITTALKSKKDAGDIAQKGTETSLIEQFLYPKLGPGQLWEEVARQIEEMGGEIHFHQTVDRIITAGDRVTMVETTNSLDGQNTTYAGDYFFSTMPVKDLIASMRGQVPGAVQEVAAGLLYRDFITVGILLKKFAQPTGSKEGNEQNLLPDTWIYIQERDVKVGRLQIFNNWSPYMVKDPNTVWIGLEYFCNEGDELWGMTDQALQRLGIAELEQMGLAAVDDVLDSTVIRMEKTYPAYFGSYQRFDEIRSYTDTLENLFLVGRNGMHKYNNSDHSMLTAMVAVDNIAAGVTSKANIWEINTEQEYHEEKEAKASEAITAQEQQLKPRLHQPGLGVPLSGNGSFKSFLWKEKSNRVLLFTSALIIVASLAVFKYFYPYASFINGDSFVYLETAQNNYSINTYPIGFSRFLRIFSTFSMNDTVLVCFQYISLQASILWLLFTLFYFLKPSRWIQYTLVGFFLLNPVFIYLANYISSDCLFLTLSIIWLTQLIWVLQRPTWRLLIWHAVVITFAFMVRYNAMFYPLVSAVAFLSIRKKWNYKLTGILASFCFIGLFMLGTANAYYKLTKIRQFSPFTGWQLANNAMYGYRFIDSASRITPPKELQALDNTVRAYYDSTKNRIPSSLVYASTVYMWDPRSPLQIYMKNQFKGDSNGARLKKWASMGPLYSKYGKFLMKSYPGNFWEYYLWPNMMKYYTPPVEFLGSYNMGRDTVNQIGKLWFGYKDKYVHTRTKSNAVPFLGFMPILAGTVNILFLCCCLGFFYLGGNKLNKPLANMMKICFCFWLLNFGFSVFASPVALRFQLFPVVLSISVALVSLDFIIREAKVPKLEKPVTPLVNVGIQ